MKIRHINCLYCDIEMKFKGVERICVSSAPALSIVLNVSAVHGVIPVSIYECPLCGKLEFFRYRKPKKL